MYNTNNNINSADSVAMMTILEPRGDQGAVPPILPLHETRIAHQLGEAIDCGVGGSGLYFDGQVGGRVRTLSISSIQNTRTMTFVREIGRAHV